MVNGISIVISFLTKYAGAGADAAVKGINRVKSSAGVAMRGLAQLGSVVGGMDGKLGQAAHGVMNFMSAVQTMGAIGGIMAGAQVAITMISSHFIEKANEMVKAAERMGEAVRKKFDSLKSKSLDEINEQLEKATTLAERAAARFEALAAAYMKVAKARAETSKSGENAVAAGLDLDKARAMAGESDKDKRAVVGAEYDVRIARQNLANARADGANDVDMAKREARDANARKKAANRTEREAQAAAQKAAEEYARFENAGADKNKIADLKAKKDEAEKALERATNDRIAKTAASTAADENVTKAERNRLASILGNERALVEAETSLKDLKAAQAEAAAAMRERKMAEEQAAKAAAEKARRDAERSAAEKQMQSASAAKNAASSEVSRWQGEFNQAFDLWRDPEAAQQAVDADKKRGEDMKSFRKAVGGYGAKWRIDEYASLMREGDEDGMQNRLEQWRKSAKFTPQVEQMVKAAAADQNRNAAEKSLANIEKNTADLAKKIDELLAVK